MAGAATCDVTGIICNIDGSAVEGAQIRATVKSTEVDQGGQVASGAGITSEKISAISQSDGTFSLMVIQGATILLEIPEINLKKEVVIPAQATVDFVDLI